MFLDLITLYLLAVGTLLASAGMTFWEYRTHPRRSRELRSLAAGFAVLAMGCAAVLYRRELPGAWGSAFSNLIMLSGYLLILDGAAALNARRHRALSAAVLASMALIWAALGSRWLDAVWNYVSAAPIALVSALTMIELARCQALKPLQGRFIVVAAAGIHALFYAIRALVLPWLAARFGPAILPAAGKLTLYEGVLYSVILPMALLKLIREEAHLRLLKEAQTDYLTQLGNRRWFFEEGTRIMHQPGTHEPVALLAFDLDQFKAINDLYGHAAGDRVLQSFANVGLEVLGPKAIFARIGGEEFAALLPGHDAHQAATVGRAIASRFAEATAAADAYRIPATVSIGMAAFAQDAPALAQGLAAADRALYRAKTLGGNRLEVAAPDIKARQADSATAR